MKWRSASNASRNERTLNPDEYQIRHESFDTDGTKKVTVYYEAENKEGDNEVFTDSFTVTVTEVWEEYYTTGIEVRKSRIRRFIRQEKTSTQRE